MAPPVDPVGSFFWKGVIKRKGHQMKKGFVFIAAVLAAAAATAAETVINFSDGSTYTLDAEQEIYISTPSSSLFKRQLMNNKDTFFRVQQPWAGRDYVEQPTDDLEIGSHEWCLAYVPWSEGYTFNMQWWQRVCDTNGDGVYSELDEMWA